jgi:hypothetical protein
MFPVCSFCGERPVVAWFEGPDFKRLVDAAEKMRAEDAWCACSSCRSLVLADDREALVRRGVGRHARRHPGSDADPKTVEASVRRAHDQLFCSPRSS